MTTMQVTILVLSYLMVLEGPRIIEAFLALFPHERGERIRRVGGDCARTVTGYISGNLLISVICGVLTFVALLIMRVPFAGLIALFVAITDLIPLIGATLGAVAAVLAAFTMAAGWLDARRRRPADGTAKADAFQPNTREDTWRRFSRI